MVTHFLCICSISFNTKKSFMKIFQVKFYSQVDIMKVLVEEIVREEAPISFISSAPITWQPTYGPKLFFYPGGGTLVYNYTKICETSCDLPEAILLLCSSYYAFSLTPHYFYKDLIFILCKVCLKDSVEIDGRKAISFSRI